MYLTKEKIQEVTELYSRELNPVYDLSNILLLVYDILKAEADALTDAEPHATRTISDLYNAAETCYELSLDVEE